MTNTTIRNSAYQEFLAHYNHDLNSVPKETYAFLGRNHPYFDYESESVNRVVLIGTIADAHMNTNALVVYVDTFDGRENRPKVVFHTNGTDIADYFKKGDLVKIVGHVQSVKRNTAIVNQDTSYIVGDTIDSFDEELAQSLDMTYKSNRASFKGVVVDVRNMDKVCKIFLKTVVDGHVSFIPVDYYLHESNPFEELKLGEVMEVHGCVQTSVRRKFEGRIFHNFVIQQYKVTSFDDEISA